jgi:hypothetical protein
MADEGANPSDESSHPSVFEKFVKTITFDNGYHNDGKDPGFKALNAAAVNSATAMSGLKPGASQNLVRGNTVFHYTGDHYGMIDGNDTLEIAGMQTHTIAKNAEFLYLSDYLRGVHGNEAIRVNGEQTIIVLGTSEENYVGTHEVTAPAEFEWKSFERGFSFTKLDLMGIGFDFHGAEITAKGADVDVGVENAEGSVFHHEIKLTHEKEEVFYTKVGLEADVLLRVDALLDVGVGTPFR